MRALVTGVAGFVGSHLAERLCRAGADVLGVDAVTPYYDVDLKRGHLAALRTAPEFRYLEADLRTVDLAPLLAEVDVVFHQAGQPGVRASWAEFDSYVEHNVLVTHRLLEAARLRPLSRFVFASSSSIYGNAPVYPTREDALPTPLSPYGVTKLAAEHLCGVYARNWGVPTVALRYFTVYGPRQRPDMAIHRLIACALDGDPFPLYGSGDQVRDFTFVRDVVEANLAAAHADVPPGTVCNVAGGGSISLAELVRAVERLTGRRVLLDARPPQAGDVYRTGGDIAAAEALLGWRPRVSVEDGLEQQVRWHQSRSLAPA